jgi:hypothetical protein
MAITRRSIMQAHLLQKRQRQGVVLVKGSAFEAGALDRSPVYPPDVRHADVWDCQCLIALQMDKSRVSTWCSLH